MTFLTRPLFRRSATSPQPTASTPAGSESRSCLNTPTPSRSLPSSLGLLGLALAASLSLGACATSTAPMAPAALNVPPPRAVSMLHWQDQSSALAAVVTHDLQQTYAQHPPGAWTPPSVCVSLPEGGPTSAFEDAFSTLFSNGLTQAGAQVQLDLNQCDYLIGLTFQSVPFTEPLDAQSPQLPRQEVMVEASAITPQGTTVSAHSVIFSAPPLDQALYSPPQPILAPEAASSAVPSVDPGVRQFPVTP